MISVAGCHYRSAMEDGLVLCGQGSKQEKLSNMLTLTSWPRWGRPHPLTSSTGSGYGRRNSRRCTGCGVAARPRRPPSAQTATPGTRITRQQHAEKTQRATPQVKNDQRRTMWSTLDSCLVLMTTPRVGEGPGAWPFLHRSLAAADRKRLETGRGAAPVWTGGRRAVTLGSTSQWRKSQAGP